jgi:hypothetical protein
MISDGMGQLPTPDNQALGSASGQIHATSERRADSHSYPDRQTLVGKFRDLGPTSALPLLHHPPFESGALFTTEHTMHISGVGSMKGRARQG